MSTHTCDSIVICCMDFRFQTYIRKWLEEEMNDKTYDLVGFAGSTKNLPIIMEQVRISITLHHTSHAVLIHHEDCGAYGVESTLERHTTDLHKAKDALLELYPDLTVSLLYIHLNGTFEKIV